MGVEQQKGDQRYGDGGAELVPRSTDRSKRLRHSFPNEPWQSIGWSRYAI
jgi:hypothetical protein